MKEKTWRAPATTTAQFVVTLEATDAPPNWAEKALVLVEQEMQLRFGHRARVHPLPEAASDSSQ